MASEIERAIAAQWKQISTVVPDHVTPERLSRIAVSAIRRTPKLGSCSTASLLEAVTQAAILGIEPNDGTGRAYLIPYGREAQLQLGYRGVVDLAYRSGQIALIDCQVVREGDDFEVGLGTEPSVHHIPCLDGGGAMRGVYAVVRVKGTDYPVVEVMGLGEIERIKRMSRGASKGDSPWQQWPEEMARKSVLRRATKRCPSSTELHRALAYEDAHVGVPLEDAMNKNRAAEILASAKGETEAEAEPEIQSEPEPDFELGEEES